MAYGSTRSRRVYIHGSAYVLTISNELNKGKIGVRLRVVGSKASSSIKYTVELQRNRGTISSHPRTGNLGPKSQTNFWFTNVANKGALGVRFDILKKGLSGSGGHYNMFYIALP